MLMVMVTVMAAGCGPRIATICQNVFIGDPSKPPEAILVVSDGISAAVDVNDGDAVPLVEPPQGGDVAYVSARVRNVDSCNVSFRGRLSDPVTNFELGFEARSSDLVPSSDGWGRAPAPLTSYFTNVALCPDNDAFDVQGRVSTLSITVTDKANRTVTASKSVVPTCRQQDSAARSLCVCDCSAIPPDAGARMCGNK